MDSSGEMGMLDPNAPSLLIPPPLSPPPGYHYLSPNFALLVKISWWIPRFGALLTETSMALFPFRPASLDVNKWRRDARQSNLSNSNLLNINK